MGNYVMRHIENGLKSFWNTVTSSPSAWFTILLSIVGGAYLLGQHNMEAKKDREIIETITEYDAKIIDIEHQHQLELKEGEREVDIWKEKYFQLLMKRTSNTSNNSGPE